MVNAIVLIKTSRQTINELAQKLLEIKGIAEVYSVAGAWDLVAILRAKDNEQLADIVTSRMDALQGIQETQTLVAFRAFSRFDLEVMFNVGLD
jgi:DNA-binding Lrp family transcriptional regulator